MVVSVGSTVVSDGRAVFLLVVDSGSSVKLTDFTVLSGGHVTPGMHPPARVIGVRVVSTLSVVLGSSVDASVSPGHTDPGAHFEGTTVVLGMSVASSLEVVVSTGRRVVSTSHLAPGAHPDSVVSTISNSRGVVVVLDLVGEPVVAGISVGVVVSEEA